MEDCCHSSSSISNVFGLIYHSEIDSHFDAQIVNFFVFYLIRESISCPYYDEYSFNFLYTYLQYTFKITSVNDVV